jgi:para-nitrobenzyl esterase
LPHTPDQYDFGAFHTGEVPYAYANLEQSDRPWSEKDRQLSEAMASYWVSFARDGIPDIDVGPTWEPFDPESTRVIHFGDSVYTGDLPNNRHFELLNEIYTEEIDQFLINQRF